VSKERDRETQAQKHKRKRWICFENPTHAPPPWDSSKMVWSIAHCASDQKGRSLRDKLVRI
jgi:hypothetical protein